MTWRNSHSDNLVAKKKVEHVIAEDVRERLRIRLLLENIDIPWMGMEMGMEQPSMLQGMLSAGASKNEN